MRIFIFRILKNRKVRDLDSYGFRVSHQLYNQNINTDCKGLYLERCKDIENHCSMIGGHTPNKNNKNLTNPPNMYQGKSGLNQQRK